MSELLHMSELKKVYTLDTCSLFYVNHTSINLLQSKFPKVIQLIYPSLAPDAKHLNIILYYKVDIIILILEVKEFRNKEIIWLLQSHTAVK